MHSESRPLEFDPPAKTPDICFPAMSSSNNNSFQILLEAEQQASALVNEARQCKLILKCVLF